MLAGTNLFPSYNMTPRHGLLQDSKTQWSRVGDQGSCIHKGYDDVHYNFLLSNNTVVQQPIRCTINPDTLITVKRRCTLKGISTTPSWK